MDATLTDLARRTETVFRAVRAGREVTITSHGKPLAKIQPVRARTKEQHERLLGLFRRLGPMDLPRRK